VERELRKDGDCGIQEMMFVGLLPVVLHIRGRDTHYCSVNARALRFMKDDVSTTQKIHLHCFAGTPDQVLGLSAAFSRCYFSISVNCEYDGKLK
ncbi:hypothetical protein DPMN_112479, partial [Dreissena polymorpha]